MKGAMWVWLSFADEDRFLGLAVVEVQRSAHSKVWMFRAIRRAWDMGINPGGEVVAFDVTASISEIPESLRNRLLSKGEAEEIGQSARALLQ